MEEHLKICINLTEKCPKCSLKIRINDPKCNFGKDHDCFKELKQKVSENEIEMTHIKYKFGMLYPNNCCPSGHKMKMHRGKMFGDEYAGGKVLCDGCDEKSLEHQEYYYNCNKSNCQYDLCRLCAL